jgi:hypothetical protein
MIGNHIMDEAEGEVWNSMLATVTGWGGENGALLPWAITCQFSSEIQSLCFCGTSSSQVALNSPK